MSAIASAIRELDDFDSLSSCVRYNFAAVVKHDANLFCVDAGDLYQTYLSNLPADQVQYHTCDCCRTFINRFGSLASISERGDLVPAMWAAHAPDHGLYQAAVEAMAKAVSRGTVTGVFLSKETLWGTPEAGNFTHFSVMPPKAIVHRDRLLTAGQTMAAKREDFRTLSHGLAEYKKETVERALALLMSESLSRSEKVLGPAKFLMQLHTALEGARGKQLQNIIWKAVSGAPKGFSTPRSSMVGTLLDDLVAGLDVRTIQERFAKKMAADQYLRPQAAPAAGNIAQAEKIVAQLGIEPSLHRRYARLEEIETIWTPKAPKVPTKGAGVFGHIVPKGENASASSPMVMPSVTMTWEKFARTVLPDAEKIDVFVSGSANFGAIVTATNPDAPPILQWDHEDKRNPFSDYVYTNGSHPTKWHLSTATWVRCNAVSLRPNVWGGAKASHHAKGAMMVLDGARDTGAPGLALFPEILKSDLNQIRSTIERFSGKGELTGGEDASACGLIITGPYQHPIRVTTATSVTEYRIDRWD